MLNVTKATGLDVISARFLRKILKQAKMSPIYKKGNKSDPSIYISFNTKRNFKGFEKVVNDQIYKYICKNNFLYELQSCLYF